MSDQIKNLLIGVFVLSAFFIVIFVMMFLHPGIGDEGLTLRVRFVNIDKVSIGTRVTLAGRAVGEVLSIQEIPNANDRRVGTNGFIYFYELELGVDSRIRVYNSDSIDIRTSGLLGDRSISINPGVPKPGEELRVINDEIIYATESASIEETLKEFKELADSFEAAFDEAAITFKAINTEKVISKISNTIEHVQSITEALNKPEQWSTILANIRNISEKLNKSWPAVDKSLQNILQLTSKGTNILSKVGQGEGTFGKLLMKDDLYLKASALLSKAETTLNDVNHYGILFHLDKGWQRMRARRMNLLQKLSTPQEFRNFFNDEIDQVATSLNRVAIVLDQQECMPPFCCDLLLNGEYTKVYRELLRRVSDLQEALEMYNQQVADIDDKKSELYNLEFQ